MIRELDEAQLLKEREDASTPLVIDFHAEWCGYCKRTRPHLERLADERADVRFVAFDADQDPDVFGKFRFKTLPAILLFKDGTEISRHESGDYDTLAAWLAANGI